MHDSEEGFVLGAGQRRRVLVGAHAQPVESRVKRFEVLSDVVELKHSVPRLVRLVDEVGLIYRRHQLVKAAIQMIDTRSQSARCSKIPGQTWFSCLQIFFTKLLPTIRRPWGAHPAK